MNYRRALQGDKLILNDARTTFIALERAKSAAAAHEPTPSESSFELLRGLYVSEEFVDTIPGALVDELFKD